MKVILFITFLFIILIPLVLGITIPIYRNHKNVTGNIINYDSFMRKYVYKVYLSKNEIIKSLNTSNNIDELSCTFEFEKNIIRFAEYGSEREYYFQILEYDDFSILKLEQVALLGMKSHIPYKLNPFMVSKLQAEIVPFTQYGF